MNNEQQELLDDAHENYKKEIIRQRQIQKEEVARLRSQGKRVRVSLIELLTQEEFIDECKTDTEFSERWGLKIEERTTLEQVVQTNPVLKGSTTLYPRKLITITYNDKTIESYG
jgi:hypothetical protein